MRRHGPNLAFGELVRRLNLNKARTGPIRSAVCRPESMNLKRNLPRPKRRS